MHTRSSKSKETGLFTVTVWDWSGSEYFRGEFADLAKAEQAAATHERQMTMKMMAGDAAPLTLDDILSDDELLAALEA